MLNQLLYLKIKSQILNLAFLFFSSRLAECEPSDAHNARHTVVQ